MYWIFGDRQLTMRIQRNQTRLFSKRSRRWDGCLPFLVLVGTVIAVVALGRAWIGQWLNQHNPHDATIDLQGAQEAFAQGDLNTTVEYASYLLESSPSHKALVTLVRALIYRSYSEYNLSGDREEALTISAQGLSQFPRDNDVLAIRAFALQANGRAEEASRLALRVISDNPQHVMARITLSLAYGSQGIFEAALREAEVAVRLGNESGNYQMDSYRVLAIAQSDLGRYQDAILSANRAIELHRRLTPLYFERALYYMQIGNTDQATVNYFQVMAYEPDNIKVRFRLCELSSSMRERDTALRYCGDVTKRAPEWSDGWYQLGREFFLQGDFINAQASFNQCTTLQIRQNVPIPERRFECWYLQGQSAEILGDCDALRTTYSQFVMMSSLAEIPQTWTYPPEGPPECAVVYPTVTAFVSNP